MISPNTNNTRDGKRVSAVGLLSGGLDSTLAAKIIKDLGVDVTCVYFAMPWGCCNKQKAVEAARLLDIKVIVLQLDERYLEMVRAPKHGRGTALNPCVDCRIHMFKRAAQYMRHINADFLFTGEVLGQRPMSQVKRAMRTIEKEVGIEGYLLRPLSAQMLPETIPEKEGWIDRAKLLALTGRSRKDQIRLADEFNLTGYSQPAGGCLLTDHNFARRMKDTFRHGYRNFRETVALKWGRHFRMNDDFKAILGRDADENDALIRYAHPDDVVMTFKEEMGPTLILKGDNPGEDILRKAAGLIQKYSRYKNEEPMEMKYWKASDKNAVGLVCAAKVDEDEARKMYI